jgi:hypothetical protein
MSDNTFNRPRRLARLFTLNVLRVNPLVARYATLMKGFGVIPH